MSGPLEEVLTASLTGRNDEKRYRARGVAPILVHPFTQKSAITAVREILERPPSQDWEVAMKRPPKPGEPKLVHYTIDDVGRHSAEFALSSYDDDVWRRHARRMLETGNYYFQFSLSRDPGGSTVFLVWIELYFPKQHVPISSNTVKVVEEVWDGETYQNIILTTQILPGNREVWGNREKILQEVIDLAECAAIVIAVDDGKIDLF